MADVCGHDGMLLCSMGEEQWSWWVTHKHNDVKLLVTEDETWGAAGDAPQDTKGAEPTGDCLLLLCPCACTVARACYMYMIEGGCLHSSVTAWLAAVACL